MATDLKNVREMLATLVAFDTTSRNSNMALIEWMQAELSKHGVKSRLFPNDDGSKANLFATIGPDIEGGVVLSGHTDVVPIDDQDWSTDPWDLTERDSKLFGRGTCDMKAFPAIAMAALPRMVASNLSAPIHFAWSYDEEVGCIGVGSMIEGIIREVPQPRAVIVGEPTDMKVVSAHKGVTGVRTVVTGHPGHSSQPNLGVSSIMIAGQLIELLERMNQERAAKVGPDSMFTPAHTTTTVNKIEGGTALNIMAGHCEFLWDIRSLPEDDPADIVSQFEAAAADLIKPWQDISDQVGITCEVQAGTPALRHETDNAADELARLLTGDNQTRGVPYAAEAGQFQEAGLATVICGPGSIDQAHQPDEFITLEQLALGTKFIDDLIDHLAA